MSWSDLINLLSLLSRLVRSDDRSKDMSFVKEFVCYFQKNLIELLIESGEEHQNLRKGIASKNESKVEQHKSDLLNLLQRAHTDIIREARKKLQNMFEARRGENHPSVRVCIKLLNSDNKIVTYPPKKLDPSRDYSTIESPEFSNVRNKIEKEGFFMINNIPKEVQKKDGKGKPIYRNNRIDQAKVDKYKPRWKWFNYLLRKPRLNHIDKAWVECWKGGEKFENSCYKSTLIVPITLVGHAMSSKVLKKLDFRHNKDNIDQGLTTGLLCVDSIVCNAFDERDSKIAYIFADLISIFFCVTRNLTETSTTYKNAEKMLKEVELKKNTNVKPT